jgi:predicted small secreted protein
MTLKQRHRDALVVLAVAFASGVVAGCGTNSTQSAQLKGAPGSSQRQNSLGGFGTDVQRAYGAVAGSQQEANKESATSAGQ